MKSKYTHVTHRFLFDDGMCRVIIQVPKKEVQYLAKTFNFKRKSK